MTKQPVKLPVVPLPGLTLDTLGLYLASLGLLRLLSREWPQIRGCWREGVFTVVAGPKRPEDIEVSVLGIGHDGKWTSYGKPWDDDQKKDTKLSQAKKPVGHVAAWRALVASEDEVSLLRSHLAPSEARNSFNPLFGSGGNAGNRKFASGWASARTTITKPPRGVRPEALRQDLHALLFGGSCSVLGDFGAGCWFSAANKVFNSGFKEPFSEGQITPWAMLLACEAFPILAGSASRLLGSPRASGSFPFVTRAPAPESETAAGQWLGDFWAPVWPRPLALAEIVALFQSGKAELDGKAALTAAAFAGAIVHRGVNAGVQEFRCFSLQRTTSENTFESRLSRIIPVPSAGVPFSEALRLALLLRDRLPPDIKKGKKWRYRGLQGPIDRALIDLAETLGEGREVLQVERSLALLDALEDALGKVDRNKSYRSAGVRFELLPLVWLNQIVKNGVENTIEMRLALALASLWAEPPKNAAEKARAAAPQRFLAYRLGATGKGRYWAIPKDRPLRAIWGPRLLEDNLATLARRRLLESQPGSVAPFRGSVFASLADVHAFLSSETDDEVLARWLDRFSLFDWSSRDNDFGALREWCRSAWQRSNRVDAHAMLHVFFRPLLDNGLLRELAGLQESTNVATMETKIRHLATAARFSPIASALESGDAAAAWAAAAAAYHGLGLTLADFAGIPFHCQYPRRLLAALLFPVRRENLAHTFRCHWQAPSQSQPETHIA